MEIKETVAKSILRRLVEFEIEPTTSGGSGVTGKEQSGGMKCPGCEWQGDAIDAMNGTHCPKCGTAVQSLSAEHSAMGKSGSGSGSGESGKSGASSESGSGKSGTDASGGSGKSGSGSGK